MTDLRQRGNNVFIVVLVFFTFFFIVSGLQYYIILSWQEYGVFQNTLSRLIFAMADFLVV